MPCTAAPHSQYASYRMAYRLGQSSLSIATHDHWVGAHQRKTHKRVPAHDRHAEREREREGEREREPWRPYSGMRPTDFQPWGASDFLMSRIRPRCRLSSFPERGEERYPTMGESVDRSHSTSSIALPSFISA
jgi:hypothetical protein